MSDFDTHLTVLANSAALYPTADAFRIPLIDPKSGSVRDWTSVTYRQFHQDVEHCAKYWTQKLTAEGIRPRSVVGVWLGGTTYVDVLHIYGVARAGYIPQLISLRLPNPDVILELLNRSRGKALIYDASFASIIRHGSLPMHVAVDARQVCVDDVDLPSVTQKVNGDDIVMILHTSGSTSGRPKLIPCSFAWWSTTIAKAQEILKPKAYSRRSQDVMAWMGSLCHMGQSFMQVGALQHGSCMVQFTKQAFSSAELQDMISRCGLSRINIFPTFLSAHISSARRDPKLLAQLQGLDEILISGLSMSLEDQQWALSNGIQILDCYASTEVAVMMLASGRPTSGRLPPLQPIRNGSYMFLPTSSSPPGSESGYENIHARLLELVVLAESPDCPDVSLRNADGNYHTGDLFLQVSPGKFVFCGRDDDWVKTQNSLRCDTKAIEDNVYAVCGDLVGNCVAVGNGRPSPALFVEPAVTMDAEKLKVEIIRRIRPFHSRRYMHERIVSSDFIVVVPQNTLPRTVTKGNIRRRAVEQTFQDQLDHIYDIRR